jgi:hypothetical protein
VRFLIGARLFLIKKEEKKPRIKARIKARIKPRIKARLFLIKKEEEEKKRCPHAARARTGGRAADPASQLAGTS